MSNELFHLVVGISVVAIAIMLFWALVSDSVTF